MLAVLSEFKAKPFARYNNSDSTNYMLISQKSYARSLERLTWSLKQAFDNRTIASYYGKSRLLQVARNIGPTLTPEKKGHISLHSRSTQEQPTCDKLKWTMQLKPKDINITVKYLSHSFLVMSPLEKWV